MIKFSIIIPVYKVENYLKACLESIKQQSFSNWECILIDDGSPDQSGLICDQYATKDERFVVVHKNNEGPAEARNHGLRLAKGEYVTFVDSDDEMMPETLMAYSKAIDKYDRVDVIKAGYIKYFETSSITRRYSCETDCIVLDHPSAVQKLNDESMYHGFLWNECIRRDITRGIEFDRDIRWNEDNLFSYQCFLRAASFVFLSHIAYKYYIRNEESLSNMKDPFLMINTSAEILRFRIEMAKSGAPVKFLNSMEEKYIRMFHRAVAICLTSACVDIKAFILQVPRKDVLMKNMASRVLIDAPFNTRTNLFLYKFLLKIDKIAKKLG